ncbi:unnamed protein product [Mytilus coruscus]|uniref:Uncharacterized protein n=1 Tax=Mytilus coruscus TaxID=42192 RepID=A0A6J8E9X8_MYTCO|nr:unnamed protein product [Mytilus coruscus]
MSFVTSGLQEEDKKASDVDKTKETPEDSCIRLTQMEQTQMMGSTIQFKSQIPLLQDEHPEQIEVPEEHDTSIKHKNQQVVGQFGSKSNEKASYGTSRNYAGSPQSYSQRQVTFSYMNDSDHSRQRPTASQNSQTVEKVVSVLQSDIKDFISAIYQLSKDERSNRSSSSAVHREY